MLVEAGSNKNVLADMLVDTCIIIRHENEEIFQSPEEVLAEIRKHFGK
jgi:very-short-patch-repair endonuclease